MKNYKNLIVGLLGIFAIIFSYLKYTDSDIIKQCEVEKLDIEITSAETGLFTIRGRSNCNSSNINIVALDSRKLLLAEDFEKLHEGSFEFELSTSNLPKGCKSGNKESFYNPSKEYDIKIDENGFPYNPDYPSVGNVLFSNKAHIYINYDCELYLSFKF